MGNVEASLIAAARAQVGQVAIKHENYVGGCMDGINPRCLEIGMTPVDGFDCSGFMAHCLSQIWGTDVSQWPGELRHVRDMWKVAETGQGDLVISDLEVGNMVVTRSLRIVNGVLTSIPGHIGVISKIANGEIWRIHANTEIGEVVEAPMAERKELIIGAIGLAAA